MRCPHCDARNPDTAEWCTQCFESLAPEPAADAPDPVEGAAPGPAGTAEAPGDAGAAHPPAASTDGVATDRPAGRPAVVTDDVAPSTAPTDGADHAVGEDGTPLGQDGRFRQTPEGLDWRCGVCDTWNPIERTTCVSCNQPFARSVGEDEDAEPPAVGETGALLASIALPGLGHLLLNKTASGVGRMTLFVVWLLGGLLLLREAVTAQQPALPALPLLFGALVVWAGSVYDTLIIHRGASQELLRPRILLWLVVGVIGILLLTFMASALSVPGLSGEG